jgi:hypothetical protein
MIKISPTTASGLSHAAYKLQLPGTFLPLQTRPERVRTSLSGKAIVSTWRKRQDGARATKDFNLKVADFDRLLAIAEHETVFKCVVSSADRSYLATIDVVSAERAPSGSIVDWRATVAFTIVERIAE